MLATVLLAAAGCGGNAGGSADSGSAQQSGADVFSAVDFTVSVEEGKDPVVLQLTDPQFTDLVQAEEKCYRYMRETIENTSPDLILVTGDLIYGHMDDDGSIFVDFVEFMEGFDIPWAPIFGNHDAECEMGADWMCARLEEAENCLFLQRELSGNGNYTVGIEQGDALKRVFFMLDSNGCSQASAASLANGHTEVGMGLEPDQMRWFVEVGTEILEASPETKISFVCHIPPAIFSEAFAKYGYTDTGEEKINIDRLPDKDAGDFGYIGEKMVTWDSANIVWNAMKGLADGFAFRGALPHQQRQCGVRRGTLSVRAEIQHVRFLQQRDGGRRNRSGQRERGHARWSVGRLFPFRGRTEAFCSRIFICAETRRICSDNFAFRKGAG